jgi:hypothetical protein
LYLAWNDICILSVLKMQFRCGLVNRLLFRTYIVKPIGQQDTYRIWCWFTKWIQEFYSAWSDIWLLLVLTMHLGYRLGNTILIWSQMVKLISPWDAYHIGCWFLTQWNAHNHYCCHCHAIGGKFNLAHRLVNRIIFGLYIDSHADQSPWCLPHSAFTSKPMEWP